MNDIVVVQMVKRPAAKAIGEVRSNPMPVYFKNDEKLEIGVLVSRRSSILISLRELDWFIETQTSSWESKTYHVL